MTDSVGQDKGSAVLRPRARLLRTIGNELISSETVAVLELVKNSYDADATQVLVRLSPPLEKDKGCIEVLDNGIGMSLETVQTTWMEPATRSKRQQPRSRLYGRRVLGEKGIGRFASSRLANELEVVTRQIGSDQEVRALFDWSAFDDEEKYLHEVEVLWEVDSPIEICPGGTVEALWTADKLPKTSERTHGTILRMAHLNTTWTADQINDLRKGLSRLVSPSISVAPEIQISDFAIRLELPPPYDELSGPVGPPEALKNPPYSIQGTVDGEGNYELDMHVFGNEKRRSLKGTFKIPGKTRPDCGPFKIEIKVWDRDATSLAALAHQLNTTLKTVREDLSSIAGVSVYRDGFRVLPYGEPRNDWLRLDLRRVQNPTMRLSNNQIVGYVLITSDQNRGLQDQSNREGLIEGPALDDFRTLVSMVLALLEEARYIARHPRQMGTVGNGGAAQVGGVFSDFDLASVQALARERHPDDTVLHMAIDEKSRNLQQKVEQVQAVLAQYQQWATLGQLIDVVLHEAGTPIGAINDQASFGRRDIVRATEPTQKLIENLDRRFRLILEQDAALERVLRDIGPFGTRRGIKPTEVHLEEALGIVFHLFRADIRKARIRVQQPETETKLWAVLTEIQGIFINLLKNSLYWLEQVPEDKREIAVQIHHANSDGAIILFSDSGPGVPSEYHDVIFRPYFSTKPNGTGLGLAIVGDIVSTYYAGTLELIDGGPLPGATFRITLHRRS